MARVLLAAIGEAGFVLAGAGAIRAHGLTDRPTHDVDPFTEPLISEVEFRRACVDGRRALLLAGYEVKIHRQTGIFTRMSVHDDRGQTMDVDLAANWRADAPVQMRVGPVLSESDAVAGKLAAVYSRREVRDFLDLDAIRSSGRYTDSDLLALGRKHDAGLRGGHVRRSTLSCHALRCPRSRRVRCHSEAVRRCPAADSGVGNLPT